MVEVDGRQSAVGSGRRPGAYKRMRQGDLTRCRCFFSLLAALCFPGNPRAAETPEESPLFISGEGGYHTYRIPSLITCPSRAGRRGTVLAFCEGRKNGSGDTGDIDLVLRRSLDG